MNQFNNGVIAGAYWSVIGPGKNLQLASTPDVETYTRPSWLLEPHAQKQRHNCEAVGNQSHEKKQLQL